MNTHTTTIASSSTNIVTTLPEISLDDFTELTLDLSEIYSEVIPIFLKIDWGEGDIVIYDNDVYVEIDNTNVSIINYNTVFNTRYTKKIYPSENTLYKNLHIQLYVKYSNGDYSWFKLPVSVRTYDFFEAIGDFKLVNVNILPVEGNPKEYQLTTFMNNTIVELRSNN
jgi:hypothetical protein